MSDNRVLVIGANGMLGHKLAQRLKVSGYEVYGSVRTECGQLGRLEILSKETCFEHIDASRYASVEGLLETLRPDTVINAAGMVKQRREAVRAAATVEINALFPHRLLESAGRFGARLICISTDCVFSGKKGMYTEGDVPDPEDLYGRSKLLGEVTEGNSLTIRTSMIGREIGQSHGLLEWFLSNSGGKVDGFTRAFFNGLTTLELSNVISGVVVPDRSLKGLYHISSEKISKFELLEIINASYGLDIDIHPDAGPEIDRSLDSGRFRAATGYDPPSWKAMVESMRDDPTRYSKWKQ